MALGTAAAILGGAAISAISSNSAANKAANASQQASDQAAQLQREALATQQANTATARAGGDLAINQLLNRLGLTAPGTIAGTPGRSDQPQSITSATNSGPVYNSQVPYSATQPQPGSADWNAYIAAHPDVKASWDSTANKNEKYGGDINKWAEDQYTQWGKDAGWQLPTVQAQSNDVQLSQQAQVPTYTRPTDLTAPTIAAPSYTRPEYSKNLDVSMEAFKNSPEYQAALYDITKQGGQVQASLAAQGLLNSGAALKRLQEVGQDNTVKYYGDYRDYTTGQYNVDRSRFDQNYNFDTSLASQNALAYANLGQQQYQYQQGRQDQNFNTDRAYGTDLALNNRAYETGRYDNTTNALFNMANLGQGAASQYGNAVQNSANNQSNALFSNAASQGNAALANASNLNSLIGTGVNALAYYYGNRPTTSGGGMYGPQA